MKKKQILPIRKKLKGHNTSVKNAKEIGAILRLVRKNQRRRQSSVAGLSNVGNRFIVDLEKGKPTMQIDKVLRVLREAGITMNLEYITVEDYDE